MRDKIVKALDTEIRRVAGRVKTAQQKLKTIVKSQDWVDEARKYAERHGKQVRKLITADAGRVKTFLEQERKELERMQRRIPSEVQKVRDFVQGQRREFEKLLGSLKKANAAAVKAERKAKVAKKSGGAKKRKRAS